MNKIVLIKETKYASEEEVLIFSNKKDIADFLSTKFPKMTIMIYDDSVIVIDADSCITGNTSKTEYKLYWAKMIT